MDIRSNESSFSSANSLLIEQLKIENEVNHHNKNGEQTKCDSDDIDKKISMSLSTDNVSGDGSFNETHYRGDTMANVPYEKDSTSILRSVHDYNNCNVNQSSRRYRRGEVSSGLTHECGVFGAIGSGHWPTSLDIAQIVCVGLVALQHRGQESAGIVTSEGKCNKSFHVAKGMGMVGNVFTEEHMRCLIGNLGIGHTRYSTSAASDELHCQPFVVHTTYGSMAVAHNGELVNCDELRKMVLGRGVGLSTHSDSELITQALCLKPHSGEETDGPDWPARIKNLIKLAPLSYSLVIMIKDRIYAVRDPFGNRPLCLGKVLQINESLNGECDERQEAAGWVVSSESCGFLSIGAQYVREVFPGEIIEMTKDGIRTMDIVQRPLHSNLAFCIFEYVYFARSDSMFEGQMVYAVRLQCGHQLALEQSVDADIVSSVPESGTAAAHGFSRQTGIPFAEVLCKNRYVGRSFIQPTDRLRQLAINKKFGALAGNVSGKRIILVDDSIVRGNTIGPIIRLLRNAGARAVHVRIASPPLRYPCYMGINIPTKGELVANLMNANQLANHVGADSLAYLSIEGLLKAVRHDLKSKQSSKVGHCTACLTGVYPNGVPSQLDW